MAEPAADARGNSVLGPTLARPGFFHIVAVYFDGTLTMDGRPGTETLAALDEARAARRRIIIVTGRILAELLEVFPNADEHADAIIAENGAVLTRGDRWRALAEPVPGELAAVLEAQRAGH